MACVSRQLISIIFRYFILASSVRRPQHTTAEPQPICFCNPCSLWLPCRHLGIRGSATQRKKPPSVIMPAVVACPLKSKSPEDTTVAPVCQARKDTLEWVPVFIVIFEEKVGMVPVLQSLPLSSSGSPCTATLLPTLTPPLAMCLGLLFWHVSLS